MAVGMATMSTVEMIESISVSPVGLVMPTMSIATMATSPAMVPAMVLKMRLISTITPTMGQKRPRVSSHDRRIEANTLPFSSTMIAGTKASLVLSQYVSTAVPMLTTLLSRLAMSEVTGSRKVIVNSRAYGTARMSSSAAPCSSM